MADRLLVVGGTIAALVTADAASRRGREVELLVPGGRFGSGFLPIQRGTRRLDLGPRIIELGYDVTPPSPPPLTTYTPGPHGHRPFLALIDELIRELAGDDLVPITTPEITRRGIRGRDFVLGGDLVDLPALLDDEERRRVAEEATAIAEHLGPAGLLGDEAALADLSLDDASRANHGPTFHSALLAPLAAKALAGGGGEVMATLRRKIWLPLMWPQSLAEACAGGLTYRPNRPMHTVAGGGMGAIVDRLVDRLRLSSGVEVREVGHVHSVDRTGREVRVAFDGDEAAVASDVVLATGAEDMFRLAGWSGSIERARGVFVWVDVSRDAVRAAASVLFVVDPDVAAFRVSCNTGDEHPGKVTFVCELEPSVTDDRAGVVALASLPRIGTVDEGTVAEVVHVLAGPSFARPSFANRDAHADGLRALRHADLPVDVVGVDVFGADSFNEQVIQGLAAAHRWS